MGWLTLLVVIVVCCSSINVCAFYTSKTFTWGRTDHFLTYVQFSSKTCFSAAEINCFSQFHFHFQPKRNVFLLWHWTWNYELHMLRVKIKYHATMYPRGHFIERYHPNTYRHTYIADWRPNALSGPPQVFSGFHAIEQNVMSHTRPRYPLHERLV